MNCKVLFGFGIFIAIIALAKPCLDCDCLQQPLRLPLAPLRQTIQAGVPSLASYLRWLRLHRNKFFNQLDAYEESLPQTVHEKTGTVLQTAAGIKTGLLGRLQNAKSQIVNGVTQKANNLLRTCPYTYDRPASPQVVAQVPNLVIPTPTITYLIDATQNNAIKKETQVVNTRNEEIVEDEDEDEDEYEYEDEEDYEDIDFEDDEEDTDEEDNICAACAALKKTCERCNKKMNDEHIEEEDSEEEDWAEDDHTDDHENDTEEVAVKKPSQALCMKCKSVLKQCVAKSDTPDIKIKVSRRSKTTRRKKKCNCKCN